MASKGPKPKPAHLRVIDGTHRATRHGDKGEVEGEAEKSKQEFGELKRPTYLKGEARKAWVKYIDPAWWLDISREPLAVSFCLLWQEFREHSVGFPAAKHSQMRAYMSELGLTDERNRIEKQGDDPDEFFDD